MTEHGATLFLGANFVSHDAAVFGICEGEVFAISEERFTRFKHDSVWPLEAIRALHGHFAAKGVTIGRIVCGVPMKAARGRTVKDVSVLTRFVRKVVGGCYLGDFMAREQRLWRGGRRFATLVWGFLGGTVSFREMRDWLKARHAERPLEEWVRAYVTADLEGIPVETHFLDHHDCHALSAFVAAGFEKSLVVTMDGWGDGAFTKAYICDATGLHLIAESRAITADPSKYGLPDDALRSGIFNEMSVGHAYSIITWLLGFVPAADEGKVEALAAYAKPDPALLERFHTTARLAGNSIIIEPIRFADVFHSPAAHAVLRSMQREVLSATIQRFIEDIYLGLVANLVNEFGLRQVCLAGGVAANVILNLKLFETLDLDIYVAPAMADDGIAMGAAVSVAWRAGHFQELSHLFSTALAMPYYGTQHSREQTLVTLESGHGLPVRWEWLGDNWPEHCANLICGKQQIGALFHGRCEYGPRALGNRSIVADLRNPENTKRINLLVKKRPGFQPFCPSMLDEEMGRLFEKAYLNRHMTCAFRMRPEHASEIPCAVHVDNTARVQFVSPGSNRDFHRLLKEVKRLTGYGGVINTSFNKHGRTICESPLDALTDFVDCNIDFLMLNGYLVTRTGDGLSETV